jgi:hypothetical protein
MVPQSGLWDPRGNNADLTVPAVDIVAGPDGVVKVKLFGSGGPGAEVT